MTLKSTLLLILTLFTATMTQAQKRDSIRVRVFDGSGNEVETTPKVKPVYQDRNYINVNPYLWARGAFVVGYERILHPKHAVVVDLGATYRDFIYEYLKNDDLPDAKVKTGHYVGIAYKFYPKDYDDFDGGFYLSPGFISRAYSMDYKTDDDLESYVDGSYSMTEYSFKLGFTRESGISDDIISDIYFGVGSREVTRHYYEINSATNIAEPTKEVKRVPAVYFGVKIGFTF